MTQSKMTKIDPLTEAIHEELFGIGYVDHLRPDFIKYLHIRNSEYHIFRLIHYFTSHGLNGGYLTLSRSKIASTLGRSMTTVDEGLRDLCRRGLIIRERISRDGREIVAYRVDLCDLEERIKNEKLRELERKIKTENLTDLERRINAENLTDLERRINAENLTDLERRINAENLTEFERRINAENLTDLERRTNTESFSDLEKRRKTDDLPDLKTVKLTTPATLTEAAKFGA